MSDGISTHNRRISRTGFRLCLTCRSCSQALVCPCTQRTIADRAESTIARLRYILGGSRPSQTTHQALFPYRIHGQELEPKPYKGGIPRSPPLRLASELPRLPPILYMHYQDSMPSYSKGPRGLSVPLRVASIFTGTTNSPGSSPRQRSNRYAIHAGRNLPDKEFRYLRTVIVTAAVYWGFGLVLCPAEAGLTPPLNLPAPGRRQTLYCALRLSRVLCF